jgi:trehalose utilization protein
MLWHLGKGKVFYFRPGHETYPIYHQKIPLKILTNATRWLADEQRKASADPATPK